MINRTKVRIKARFPFRPCYIYFMSCIIFHAHSPNTAQMEKPLALRKTTGPAPTNKTQGRRIRHRQKDSKHPILHRCKKRMFHAKGSQTLTKKHTSRTSFASIRHFRDSFSAQQKIIRLKAIFQCPQNLRATCTKRRKNDFLPWRRDAENPVFPRR